MAVTAGGTPYVESSDLVASYPATSLALANKVDTKLDNAPTDNAQSGTTYTFVLADARQLVTATSASAKTFTIPPQSSVTWLTGTMIRVVNYGAGALTVDGGVGVTVTNTASTLAQYQAATAIRTGSNAWTLVPFSGGAGSANFSNTATGTYSSGGFNYKYLTFAASGSLTVTKAGLCDVLIIGGGGAGGDRGSAFARNHGGGGAGGFAYLTDVYLPVSTITVTVGAGSPRKSEGGTSSTFGSIAAIGGGTGPYQDNGDFQPNRGGSGGGGAGSTTAAVRTAAGGMANQGNSGGNGVNAADGSAEGGGGGGGASAAGAVGTSLVGGAGGAGSANSITGASVTYSGGGGGARNSGSPGAGGAGGGGAGGTTTGTAGTINTGGGGGGAFSDNAAGAGGSGIIILRVKV